MSNLTLEELAKRLEELERKVDRMAVQPAAGDWWSTVGMFGDSDFSRQVDAEGEAIREADRKAAREGAGT